MYECCEIASVTERDCRKCSVEKTEIVTSISRITKSAIAGTTNYELGCTPSVRAMNGRGHQHQESHECQEATNRLTQNLYQVLFLSSQQHCRLYTKK